MNARTRGLDALRRKLATLPALVVDEMRTAMATSADEIAAMARSLVPVESGDLRASIGWTWGEPPKGSIVLAKVKSTGRQQALREGGLLITVYAGNDQAYYARWVEFGTQKTSAQPFFYVSYRALKKYTRSRARRAINKAAKKVAAS